MSELLPPNASKLMRAVAASGARIGAIPLQLQDLHNPLACPAPLLPWLAWSFSVDQWDSQWSEAQKRATIAASLPIHRQKGTVYAMKSALAALDLRATLKEWHDDGENGLPYTFGLTLTLAQTGVPDVRAWAKIHAVIDSAKNVRSHLAYITLIGETSSFMARAGVSMIGDTTTLVHEHPLYFEAAKNGTEQTIEAVQRIGAALSWLADPPAELQQLRRIFKMMSKKGFW